MPGSILRHEYSLLRWPEWRPSSVSVSAQANNDGPMISVLYVKDDGEEFTDTWTPGIFHQVDTDTTVVLYKCTAVTVSGNLSAIETTWVAVESYERAVGELETGLGNLWVAEQPHTQLRMQRFAEGMAEPPHTQLRMQRFAEDIDFCSDEEQPLPSVFQQPEEEEEPPAPELEAEEEEDEDPNGLLSYSPVAPAPEPEAEEEEDFDPNGLLSYSPVGPAQGVDEGIDEDV